MQRKSRDKKEKQVQEKHPLLGIDQALKQTLESISPMGEETVAITDSIDRVAARALSALVDSPSVNASLKDGYAVLSKDVDQARRERPVRLEVTGLTAAGGETTARLVPGTAVRVLTGARIPENADAVLSEEFTVRRENEIEAFNDAGPGRNVLQKGTDVRIGQQVVSSGQVLTPGKVGLLAAAGHSEVPVYEIPTVAIVATGDEVVLPGRPLPEGKLYASNLVTLDAWCKRYRFPTLTGAVPDDADGIAAALNQAVSEADAVLTSGGAWTGDRDMVVSILDRMGWRQAFHLVRMGPGKGVAFGNLRNVPVFILPGGPPSNLMAFFQIALPGLLKRSGRSQVGLPTLAVRMAEDVHGRSADWTQYLYGRIEHDASGAVFHPLRTSSRLRSIAEAEAIVTIPEGDILISKGETVIAQGLM
jgi:molybdopterin molybdotransferase